MQIDTRLGTYGENRTQVATRDAVRGLVPTQDPVGVVVASAGGRSVWWPVAGAKVSDGCAGTMPHTAHVNLGFFRETSLPDPDRLPEGTGKALRHVKLRQPDDEARLAIADLLRAAIAERRAASQVN